MENQRMTPQQMAEWKAAYTKPWIVVRTPLSKETRENPDIVVKYAFGEYGMDDTKDTFSASFWKPTSR